MRRGIGSSNQCPRSSMAPSQPYYRYARKLSMGRNGDQQEQLVPQNRGEIWCTVPSDLPQYHSATVPQSVPTVDSTTKYKRCSQPGLGGDHPDSSASRAARIGRVHGAEAYPPCTPGSSPGFPCLCPTNHTSHRRLAAATGLGDHRTRPLAGSNGEVGIHTRTRTSEALPCMLGGPLGFAAGLRC